MDLLPYINLGCGAHFDTRWVNIDFTSTGKGVIAHNLLKGIPFPDNHFEVAYHSHVLEHFSQSDGQNFLQECNRILKTSGTIRIAIPDLEQINKLYLNFLEKLKQNPTDIYLQACYDWIVIEMYDQTVRNQSGGNMLKYLSQEHIINEEFIIERCGFEISPFIDYFKQARINKANSSKPYRPTFKQRVLTLPSTIKRKLIEWLLGEDLKAYQIGKFRLGGEVHNWMYDEFSLKRLLSNCGFKDITVRNANESNINNWADYQLETVNGLIRKPDSLFIEAIKK